MPKRRNNTFRRSQSAAPWSGVHTSQTARVARRHIDAPVGPRAAGDVEHLAVDFADELVDGDEIAYGTYVFGAVELAVVRMQVDAVASGVFFGQPGGISHVVFLIPVVYIDVAVAHEFVHLIFVGDAP